MKIALVIIISIIPNIIAAQFHDTNQQKYLKENAIKKIEKVEINSDIDSSGKILLSIEEVNEFGFITKINSFNQDGVLTQSYEHHYLNDTLLQESILINHPTESVNLTKYTYNNSSQPKTASFYLDQNLVSVIKFKYSKENRLTAMDQTLYDRNTRSKKNEKYKRTYMYNSEGKITNMTVKHKIKGKISQEFYAHKYDSKNNIIEQYVKYDTEQNEILLEKKELDENNRIISEEKYFKENTHLTIGTRKFNINKGEALRKQFIYNDLGLIKQEIKSVNGSQRVEIRYNYTK